jgi:hypothetical protein
MILNQFTTEMLGELQGRAVHIDRDRRRSLRSGGPAHREGLWSSHIGRGPRLIVTKEPWSSVVERYHRVLFKRPLGRVRPAGIEFPAVNIFDNECSAKPKPIKSGYVAAHLLLADAGCGHRQGQVWSHCLNRMVPESLDVSASLCGSARGLGSASHSDRLEAVTQLWNHLRAGVCDLKSASHAW